VPRIGSRKRDIHVVLERQKGTVDAKQLELGGSLGSRVLGAFLVGIEWMLGRMHARVLAGEPRDDAILEHQRRIAVHEVAAIHPLSDEQRVVVRPVVVREKDLVVAAADQRDGERSPAKTHADVAAPHPEGRVLCGDEELGRRRGHSLRRRSPRRATAGEQEQRTLADGTRHRGKYTA